MKRTIIITIILAIAFFLSTISAVKLLLYAYNVHNSFTNDSILRQAWDELYCKIYLPYGILSLLAAIATLTAMIIIAIKDFPVFKPLTDKLADKRAARKEARSQAKAEQAAIAKQDRIDQLKAELDELQKDE
ncbi:hypothetical protein [Anaerocaecibacter muris]|uniref:hypothetical protein n=1 Tax=Anaerocaecibacter muris TaxID=2941513 RepID=UPI003F68BDB0